MQAPPRGEDAAEDGMDSCGYRSREGGEGICGEVASGQDCSQAGVLHSHFDGDCSPDDGGVSSEFGGEVTQEEAA